MKKHLAYLAAATLAVTATACSSDGPAGIDEQAVTELVITEGTAAPRFTPRVRPAFSDAAAAANVGGSSTTPVTLQPQPCGVGQEVVITYTVTGRQVNPASFKVNTRWEFNGTAWIPSVPGTVSVPARAAADAATIRTVTVTLINTSTTASGPGTVMVIPFDLVTAPQATLNVSAANVTIHTSSAACPVTNTAPSLVLPTDFSVEATSSAGAVVTYAVTASDAQDGDLTASVVCTPASGTTFALGTTTVNCSVTDAGGLEATGSFDVTVVDTTPAKFVTFPTEPVKLIAANIDGAVLDITTLGITVEDVGGVSEPSTWECNYVAGTVLAIGSTTEVDCTASDAIGNRSDVSTFEVFVGLNVGGTGFLPPLRMADPFSAHKRGSTIPHKFLPPTYADGTPAIDLADGLRLLVKRMDGIPDADGIEANDFSAGSTAWRFHATAGHYIFNLKTATSSPWDVGTWNTSVSFAGIPLAATQFDLRR